MEPNSDQLRVCALANVLPWDVDPNGVVGVGPLDLSPLNGLRHPPSGQTSGWYIWAGGEIPQDDEADFFHPVHTVHLAELAPQAIAYLALPPGWRFQVAPGHEDVWRDESLLAV
jgi:hypothetical protein